MFLGVSFLIGQEENNIPGVLLRENKENLFAVISPELQ